jgi:hypothetical protein
MVAILDRIDKGKGWRVRSEVIDKALNGAAIAFNINLHASCGIADLAFQGAPFGK